MVQGIPRSGDKRTHRCRRVRYRCDNSTWQNTTQRQTIKSFTFSRACLAVADLEHIMLPPLELSGSFPSTTVPHRLVNHSASLSYRHGWLSRSLRPSKRAKQSRHHAEQTSLSPWRPRICPHPSPSWLWMRVLLRVISTEVTFGRGDLSVCPLGGFPGAHEYLLSNRRVVPQGAPQGRTLRALLRRGTSVLHWLSTAVFKRDPSSRRAACTIYIYIYHNNMI